MIDFLRIDPLSIGLEIKNILTFPAQYNEETGEPLKSKRTAKYREMIFTIVPTKNGIIVKVSGSPHKFANNGLHNYDQFTFSRFIQVVEELKLLISPGDKIGHLEFGINIHTPFDPEIFIHELLFHKGSKFFEKRVSGTLCAEVNHSQYKIKIYDKGHQYGQGYILRFELKYRKMENLFPDGLKWGDLQDPDVWRYLGTMLMESFAEILYYDPSIDLIAIPSDRDRDILKEGNNPKFWDHLSGPHISRKRNQFQKAVRKYGTTFTRLPELIEKEISNLIDIDKMEKVVNSDHYSTQINDTSIPGSYEKVVNSAPILVGQFYPYTQPYISGTGPDPIPEPMETGQRFCQVTGIDISNQKPGSSFLCYRGLRWLLNTDPGKFAELRESRLSNKWFNETLDIQIREIAHSIRNEYNNPRNNTKRAISRIMQHPALFDQVPYIRPERLKLAGY